MILVPNRQQLLNGSKGLLLLCLGLFFLQACDSTKQRLDTVSTTKDTTAQISQNPPANNGEKPERPENSAKPSLTRVDSIAWCDTVPSTADRSWVICYTKIGDKPIQIDTVDQLITAVNRPNIEPQDTVSIQLKNRYTVAIILPFMAQKRWRGEVHPASLRALEFYEGAKMALDSLVAVGMQLDVHVFDTKKDSEELRSILNRRALIDADLIIGPLTRSNCQLVNEHADLYDIPVVSPFNPLSEQNPVGHASFFQVHPTFECYSAWLAKHSLANRTGRKKIIIVASPTAGDSARVKQLKQDLERHPYSDMHDISTYFAATATNFSLKPIKERFSKIDSNLVIVPSYREEGFVYAVLRELQTLKDSEKRYRDYPIRVYGLSQWMDYEKVNFQYYEDLDLHVASEYYVNKNHKRVRRFEDNYFEAYGMPPRAYAFLGFDITLFFGRLLKEYGTTFPHFVQYASGKGYFHTRFDFEPVYAPKVLDGPEGVSTEIAEPIRYENNYLHLLHFEDYRLQPVAQEKAP